MGKDSIGSKNLEDLTKKYLATARERLESAEKLLEIGNFRDSISRSYYAFLDSADAVLLAKNIRPKSHAGTISQFSLHFIKSGLVKKKYGRWFSKIEESRSEADYERDKEFGKQDAEEALREAKEFVEVIEKLLPKLLKKGD